MAGGSPIARVVGQIDAANRGSAPQGASYTPVEANVYGSPFTSQQTATMPRTSPLALQMMQRSNAVNPYGQGLQSIYSMFNAPRQLAPMPIYSVPALNYRPNMQSAQEVLKRVAPSVAEQQRLQAIEDARRAAEEEARRAAEEAARGYE
jgi:hypothetical protein